MLINVTEVAHVPTTKIGIIIFGSILPCSLIKHGSLECLVGSRGPDWYIKISNFACILSLKICEGLRSNRQFGFQFGPLV